MSGPEGMAARRGRIQLLLIFALFLAPPLLAWFAWQHAERHGVGSTSNAGVLVAPARPVDGGALVGADGAALQAGLLRGRWTYVVFSTAGCGASCRDHLYLTRQVRVAVNKDTSRVQRLLVLTSTPAATLVEELADGHADLHIAVLGSDDTNFVAPFRGEGFAPDGRQFFLLDPLGNLMMRYPAEVSGKGVLGDLRKLLKVSQIG